MPDLLSSFPLFPERRAQKRRPSFRKTAFESRIRLRLDEPVHRDKRELGEYGDHDEHEEFHNDEREQVLDQRGQLDVADAAHHIENRADRRRDNADAEVQDEDEAEVVRIDTSVEDQRVEHRSEDQDVGGKVHDHADQEQEHVDHQQQSGGRILEGFEHGDDLLGDVSEGDEVADGGGGGHDHHNGGGGTGGSGGHFQNLAQADFTIPAEAHDKGVHSGEGAAFGGREDTEADTAEQEHGHHEGGRSVDEDLTLFFLGELDVVVVAVDTDDDEPQRHQGQTDEDTGQQTDHEQLGDGQAAHAGAEDDEVGAGRDDGAEDSARGDNGTGAAGDVVLLLHHGQEQAAKSGGFAHGRTHEAGEQDGSHDGGIAKAAAHAADKELGELHHALGKAAGSHDFTSKHEERDGHQGVVVRTVEHAGGDGHRIPHVGMEHEHHGAEHEHHGDRNTEG